MAPNDNWLNRQVQGVVAGAGSFVGGMVNNVANGVSGAGRGIGNGIAGTTRGWGDGVRSYGNGIKDATRASGPRAPTAANPLGLAGGSTQSAAMLTSKVKGITAGSARGSASNPLGLK
ncbi:hypothetical protein MPH_00620 [Macrophomina phaseolina MS6]|uniref:Uncharacterized protein n=1 Tax=Macrophomina phaseolina (strain MS6) TaxID=1126212 RepID=K2SHV7_MACPH|nr:hypothetical protein MPH_00620 [Macrophomina phaseolina MS6]